MEDVLLITLSCCIICTVLTFELLLSPQASSQIISVPPPAPEIKKENNKEGTELDANPPQIEILTTELKQGKNVLKVKVTDASAIQLREVRYVHDGSITSTELVRGQNNIYKALVIVDPPSAVIVINVGDIYKNKVSLAKLFSVTASSDLFSQLQRLFDKS
jgi:hypothetical protein